MRLSDIGFVLLTGVPCLVLGWVTMSSAAALDGHQAEQAVQNAKVEVMNLKRRSVLLTQEIHRLSVSIAEDEVNLQSLEDRERRLAADLDRRRNELSHLLLTLQRFARIPPLAFAALPQAPGDTVRSILLLKTGLKTLRQERSRLESEIDNLYRLKTEIAKKRKRRDTTLARLRSEKRTVALITKEKLKYLDRLHTGRRALASPPAEAGAIGGYPTVPETTPDQNKASGSSLRPAMNNPAVLHEALPAPGHIIARFDQKLGNGRLSRGITIETRPEAPVVAPFPGRVIFADRFREYGNLVIVKSRDRHYALLAGMTRIDAVPGEEVLAGEPVGIMNTSMNSPPRLYFELRRNGRPINPLSSRAALESRVRNQ